MSKKIANMNDLRERLIETYELLGKGEIDASNVMASAKLVDTVINSLKIQMDYAKVIDRTPVMPFLLNENDIALVEVEEERKLLK